MFSKKKILMKVNNALFYCILNFENQKECRNNVLQGAKLKKKLRKNSRVIYLFIYLFSQIGIWDIFSIIIFLVIPNRTTSDDRRHSNIVVVIVRAPDPWPCKLLFVHGRHQKMKGDFVRD